PARAFRPRRPSETPYSDRARLCEQVAGSNRGLDMQNATRHRQRTGLTLFGNDLRQDVRVRIPDGTLPQRTPGPGVLAAPSLRNASISSTREVAPKISRGRVGLVAILGKLVLSDPRRHHSARGAARLHTLLRGGRRVGLELPAGVHDWLTVRFVGRTRHTGLT